LNSAQRARFERCKAYKAAVKKEEETIEALVNLDAPLNFTEVKGKTLVEL
jgi:hypothetical protein